MKRYCIVCQEMFGCIKKGKKYECIDCSLDHHCPYRDDVSRSQTTGGICKSCWEKRKSLKVAYTHRAAVI